MIKDEFSPFKNLPSNRVEIPFIQTSGKILGKINPYQYFPKEICDMNILVFKNSRMSCFW
jgi:hypothetical protein